MKLFFGQIFPNIEIDAAEQLHLLKVLRLREGDEIYLTDGKGNAAKGNLVVEGKKVSLAKTELLPKEPEDKTRLHIAISPTKNIDRIEFFLEKAIEMGVSEVSFILTDHSERKNLNMERLQKQALAASKQSLRFYFPKINELQKLGDFLQTVSADDCFVAHCNENFERSELSEIPRENLTVLIGPEGDFSEREIQLLADKNIAAISLGERRLRTETAGILLAAWHYFSK